MARKNARSPSHERDPILLKKQKILHNTEPAFDHSQQFAAEVFDAGAIQKLASSYAVNQPFKYAIVEKLFQDDLLKKVKDECLSELNFTEKETDIYKVNQTGDLASLNFLTPSQISLLPSLLALRDALYSDTFRSYLQAVTGCGPLSGTKQDMSVNSYTKGCHLLNHDDVIGSRRVSYILYMPLPHYQFWQKDWGGALELYPTRMGVDGNEPEAMPMKTIPPSWNQFIFFEVQPGKSFHSVEEVVVGGEGEDGRERLSISGWFHAAQPGEEGYQPEPPVREVKSSREQLTSTQTVFKSYPESPEPPLPETPLSEEHVSFLSEFLNPVYLQTRTMRALATRFIEESSLELHSFLCEPLASKLQTGLRENDFNDGLGPERGGRIPPHVAGTTGAWALKGPPHKWRYCTLAPHAEGAPVAAVTPRAAHTSPDEIVRSLQDELFPSAAFRAWVAGVSKLLPLRYSAEARRFRPGLDYTLATSEENEARLDVVLGLTPELAPEQSSSTNGRGKKSKAKQEPKGWQTGLWGGWECYMAPHDEEDDPAVYRSGSHKKPTSEKNGNGHDVEMANGTNGTHTHNGTNGTNGHNGTNGTNGHSNGKSHTNGNGAASSSSPKSARSTASPKPKQQSPLQSIHEDSDDGDEDEDEDDGTLLTVQPGFNRLLLVLRDERVMRFVKYVSAAAEGSRWDVCGEYEVGAVQVEDGDDDDDP
ncbi:hypothetical protein PLICRDRAFT_34124 [Plicaturopsis crispa FD-325 SS-3]|nr:hypothetical protein PLICRDRAFT_34124 [Plicaturopsis crispa FD-325 SS-3]